MDRRLRAVALCRCSTEEESQKDALASQVDEAKECIREHEWQLVDMYVEARSGTTTKGRQEYNRLFDDLGTEKFDIVVIKSQDRLMRNVKDWYLFVDRLVKNNKQLFMYLENKFYSPDDALITGIRAILAEEYSRDLSKKINNAHRHRQAEGKVLSMTNAVYGYRKLADKSIIVDEGERPLIEMIFRYAEMGYGSTVIAQFVYEAGYRNRKGGAINPHVIGNIIKNPIYTGTAVLNRKHFDFTCKKTINNPGSEWIVHENALPAIVPKETFDKANAHRAGRVLRKKREHADAGAQAVGFGGRIICGMCGRRYNRTVRHLAGGACVVEWKCSGYLMYGRSSNTYQHGNTRKLGRRVIEGCDNVHINEGRMYGLLLSLCGAQGGSAQGQDNAALIDATLRILRKTLAKSDTPDVGKLREDARRLAGRKDILLEKLLDGIITDEDYKNKLSEIEGDLSKIEDSIRRGSEVRENSREIERRVCEIEEALENGIVDKVKAGRILGGIREIKVFPDTLEIKLSAMDAAGVAPMRPLCGEPDDAACSVSIVNDCAANMRADIEKEKQQILHYLKENPGCTLAGLAGMRHEPVSRVRRRAGELKKEGVLEFGYMHGKKCWIVKDEA